jgi:pilus assembly protein Flp/PilA
MRDIALRLRLVIVRLRNEDGQDLVEYALVLGLILLAAAAGMSSVAAQIGAVFATVGTMLSTYTS